MKCCPTCGRSYPPQLEVHGSVRPRIVKFLLARPSGIEMPDLIELVYSTAPDGAPASARNCINVMAHMANQELKPQGWRIVGTKGRGSRYRLVRINADTVKQRTGHHHTRKVAGA